MRSLSTLLNKIFVLPFYKKHAGLFFFLVATFLFALIYINALDKLPEGKKLYWNLIVVIKLFSNPYAALLLGIMACFYVYKAVVFFIGLLADAAYAFLYITYGTLSRGHSFLVLFKSFLAYCCHCIFIRHLVSWREPSFISG